MASVSADDVRDVINVTSEEVPDEKVLKMIKRAEVTLELETNREIEYTNCTDAEKEFITVLAAIYAICYLTGGSAVGLSFSVGDQNVSVLSKAPPLDVLQIELEPSNRLVYGMYFAFIALICLTTLEVTYILALRSFSNEIFAAISMVVGTILGTFFGQKA